MNSCIITPNFCSNIATTHANKYNWSKNTFYYSPMTKEKDTKKGIIYTPESSFVVTTCRDTAMGAFQRLEKRVGSKKKMSLGIIYRTGPAKKALIRDITTEMVRVINIIEDKLGWQKTALKTIKNIAGPLSLNGNTTTQQGMNSATKNIAIFILQPTIEWYYSTVALSIFMLIIRAAAKGSFKGDKTYSGIMNSLKEKCKANYFGDSFRSEHFNVMEVYLKNIKKIHAVNLRKLNKSNSPYMGIANFCRVFWQAVAFVKFENKVKLPKKYELPREKATMYGYGDYVNRDQYKSRRPHNVLDEQNLSIHVKEAIKNLLNIISTPKTEKTKIVQTRTKIKKKKTTRTQKSKTYTADTSRT